MEVLSGFPFGEWFVDNRVSKVFFDATMIINIATEQVSSYVFVTFDADEIVISFVGGGQLPLVWRQVGCCGLVVLPASSL